MYYDIYYFLFFLFLHIFDNMMILAIILGSLYSLYLILTAFNRGRAKLKLEIPRKRSIYYNNKEYKYKLHSFFFTFLGDFTLNKTRIKVYSVKRILGIPFKKHINTSEKIYLDSTTLRNLSNFKSKLIYLIIEYNDKDSQPGWDGCLDEASRIARKRNKNIDTIVDD